MLNTIYSVISMAVIIALAAFVTLLLLRLVFSFSDPNPFGAMGRLAFQVRKITERFVYPAARVLAQFGIDSRYAPVITILISCALAFFALQVIGGTLFIISVLSISISTGNMKALVGIVIYALLSIYVIFIFIRFVSSWFVFTRNTFLGFVQRVTDPVLIPFRRLIPPVGMFDISAMILLILISLLQSLVLRAFVYS